MQYRSVTVLAPAKLNLSLDVVGTLPNGYHDLDMVMQTIDLYEKITLRRSNDLSLTLPGSFVPVNDKNTAVKAALAFFDYTGLLAGVDMTIYKRVPVRAGMAGGSADAAGVLVGLNELYGAHLSMSELCAIGAGIGADVPFALLGGTCRVRGVGDLMKALPPCPDCRFVVAMPSVGVSTPEAFARQPCPPRLRGAGAGHPRLQFGRGLRRGRQRAGALLRCGGDARYLQDAAGAWGRHGPDDRQRRGGVRHF